MLHHAVEEPGRGSSRDRRVEQSHHGFQELVFVGDNRSTPADQTRRVIYPGRFGVITEIRVPHGVPRSFGEFLERRVPVAEESAVIPELNHPRIRQQLRRPFGALIRFHHVEPDSVDFQFG